VKRGGEMAKSGNVACIDIGSTKICVLVANVSDSNIIQILGTGVSPSMGIQRGLITDINDAKRSIYEAVQKAEQSSGLRVSQAYVGFSGKHIGSLNNRVAVGIDRDDHLVTPAVLRQGRISVHKITLPQDRSMIHVIPRRYFLDGVTGIRNPIGMHGFRLDLEAHIITAGIVHTQNIMVCMEAIGVGIEGLVVNPLASGEAALEMEDREAGVILADIGGGTTDIAVYNEGSAWHTSCLPVGGTQVTRDLATGLGIPFNAAEEIKVNYGSLIPSGDNKTSAISSETQEKFSFSQEDLCYIIRARMEEVLRMILLEIPRSDYTPSAIVLTGGTAKLAGIEEFGRQVTGLPVRVEIPKGLPDNAGDRLIDPAFSSSVGMLLWGALQDEEDRVDLSGGLGRLFTNIVRSIKLPRLPRIRLERS